MARTHILAITLMLVFLVGPALTIASDEVYQVSVIHALMEGLYDSIMSFGDLANHGDFGLGTVSALDGEMVAIDGQFFQVRADGLAYVIPESQGSPFAVVTFFTPDRVLHTTGTLTQDELQALLADALIPNIPYAIHISGHFPKLLLRSVGQQEKPYPRLADALAGQVEFTYYDVAGDMIGFWTPPYFEGVNVTGFHFHFIDAERQRGGHVLGFETANVRIEIDEKDQLVVWLPINESTFRSVDLAAQSNDELAHIEQAPVATQ